MKRVKHTIPKHDEIQYLLSRYSHIQGYDEEDIVCSSGSFEASAHERLKHIDYDIGRDYHLSGMVPVPM